MKKLLPVFVFLFRGVTAFAQTNYEPYQVRTVVPTANGDPIGSHASIAPADMAFDANGNLFVADYAAPGPSRIRKIAPNGAVTTVASDFFRPQGLVFDAAGTLYVCDTDYHGIRKILPDGSVHAVAGLLSLSGGYADGPAGEARFTYPTGIAIDAQGFIYVTDRGNNIIRKITPDGFVSTLAGLAGSRGSVDGKGDQARFSEPNGIAVDAAGILYVTDSYCVRKITPDGTVTTLAGGLGQSGYAEGKGTNARFGDVRGITISPLGYLCVVDGGNGRVRKVTADGTVSTIAGGSPALYLLDPAWFDGVGEEARFRSMWGIEVDQKGNLFVAQTGRYLESGEIRKVTPDGVVTTLPPGTLYNVFGKPDDTGAIPPMGIADLTIDKAGNVFVADSSYNCIHKITPAGVMSTIRPLILRADGKKVPTSITPSCLAVDNAGNLFFFDGEALGKITPDGSLILFAGDNIYAGSDDGVGYHARFRSPARMAIDKDDNLYVADAGNYTIRKITPSAVVTTFAGSAANWPFNYGTADGKGAEASFAYPLGVATDLSGNVYVADAMYAARSNSIRKITPDGVVTTLAGSPGQIGHIDGVGSAAQFDNPTALAADSRGNVYVADAASRRLRKVTPGGTVTTLAGSDTVPPWIDGIGGAATFDTLMKGLARDSAGNVYVADSGRIRLANPTLQSRSLNVSTRLQVMDNENVLIGGFIINGSSTKKLILRALGPSLSAYSVTGVLSDPAMELYDGKGVLIASNDNWRFSSQTQQSQEAAILATTMPPSDDREPAIVATLDPQQAYTVVVHGAHGEKGISTVEAYDLTTTNAAALANISTRGFVEPGEKVMIAGFILGGNTGNGEMLLRALGPSLTQSGIANPLANPTLALFNANGQLIAYNDDWGTDAARIQATGLQPPTALESAISIALPAGAYTAVVGGYGQSGVALVEAYNLP